MTQTAEEFAAKLKAQRSKIPHVFTYEMKVYRLLRQRFNISLNRARHSLESWDTDKAILWTCKRLNTTPHTCAELLLDHGNI